MEYKQYPPPNSLALAKIEKIMQFGAYCKLLEYNNTDAYLPIREVSSGWIKNIHEFIHEGQTVVCKIIYIDREKGTIDISLKKVTSKESKDKMGAFNLDNRLKALCQRALKEVKLPVPQRAEINDYIISQFKTYTNFVKALGEESGSQAESEEIKVPKRFKEAVLRIIEASRQNKRYIVAYDLSMSTQDTMHGIDNIKDVLRNINNADVKIDYVSAPKYKLVAEGTDYIDAEEKIKQAVNIIKDKLKSGNFNIEKEKLKKEKEDIMDRL
ncbi:translation initiation factor IF-2 subunit alpha [mine drainage metagenome]|uniref:Translation initiation factor IF-2 subunit alpha n=1 Tax=mine drainage metagenome TaxID=410659 RepID=T0ZB58_9ZZZZ